MRIGSSEKIPGAVKLHNPSLVHDQHSVGIDDGVDAVGNGEHRAVAELSANGLLDECVRVEVDGRRRLVQHQNASTTKQCPRQTDQLTLTHGQVGPILRDDVVETIGGGVEEGAKVTVHEGVQEQFVTVHAEGIQIGTDGTGEEDLGGTKDQKTQF